MWRILNCIVYQHDYRLVAIAVIICILGSVTIAMMLQRALAGGVELRSGL